MPFQWVKVPPTEESGHCCSHVWTAPLRQVLSWRGDDCGRVRSCVWPVGAAIVRPAGADVVREVGPDHIHGLDTLDYKKVLPPHHAISTSAIRDTLPCVPLALALQSCAAAAAITSLPSLLSGNRARLRSILGGAMAGLVDATAHHEDPGDPSLIGDRDRRLLGRHAAEQLRDPGMLVRAFLRLAHNGHRAVNEE